MTMQDMLNDLIDKGLITPPTPDAVPHDSNNFPYTQTIRTYSLDLRNSEKDKTKDA